MGAARAAAAVAAAQFVVILVMWAVLRRRDTALRALAVAGVPVGEAEYGVAPRVNARVLEEVVRAADYDHLDPAVTGVAGGQRYTTLLGRFSRCGGRSCDVELWPYLGDKCFFRNNDVKDRQAHNASIWSLVQRDVLYMVENDFGCPVEICRRQWKNEMNATEQIVLRALLLHFGNDTPWNTQDMYSANSYVRTNPFWGLEYKINGFFTLTKTLGNGEDVQENKTASITIRRGFTQKFCDVSLNLDIAPPEEPVYIVVPYTGRVEQLRGFYGNIKSLLDEGVSLRVIIATHGGPIHMLGASELLREMQIGLVEGELTDGHIVQVVAVSGDATGNFSRSLALMDGAKYVPAEGLMFYCDVDMTIKKDFFDNCRYNAHRNYQVYYPVVYSLFPYGTTVSKEHGYWRKGAFGMVCGYKSDFRRVKEWDTHSKGLRGWGVEDVLLKKGFNNHWQISVFQAIEPNLLHRYHVKYCEFNAHISACLGTIFQNMGSQQFLAAIVASRGIDVSQIKYEPPPLTFEQPGAVSVDRPKSSDAVNGEGEAKTNALKQRYEDALATGQIGLLSVFARDAHEAMMSNDLHQAPRRHPQLAPVLQPKPLSPAPPLPPRSPIRTLENEQQKDPQAESEPTLRLAEKDKPQEVQHEGGAPPVNHRERDSHANDESHDADSGLPLAQGQLELHPNQPMPPAPRDPQPLLELVPDEHRDEKLEDDGDEQRNEQPGENQIEEPNEEQVEHRVDDQVRNDEKQHEDPPPKAQ